ncbi:NAD-dependent protein deacetylase [Knoellia koreensis]|uniref:protein acetyllysine N-acetyltransferase n=1 Tax=Knoellia koreensis TaxID=2730921 RepID=A0A849HLC6_9MICO|nr:NAD-dependent protein deacetylase [Knoellia sp. DB2414S]
MVAVDNRYAASASVRAVDAVADVLAAGNVLVLSGAGISTESGIPDYRGPDGERRVTPMQYSEFTGSSEARQRYWARSYVGWQRFNLAGPNAGHRAVTRLQRAGLVGSVITQNVDGLHQASGTTNVTELHGSLAKVVCLTCGDRTSRWDLDDRMRDANPDFTVTSDEIRPDGDIALNALEVESFRVPLCLVCNRDTLKPEVVFFGESVPKPLVENCFQQTEQASALLVLGSSLKVMSGYRFVRRAHARGIPVVIITRGPTRGDAEATLQLDASLGTTLTELADVLGA